MCLKITLFVDKAAQSQFGTGINHNRKEYHSLKSQCGKGIHYTICHISVKRERRDTNNTMKYINDRLGGGGGIIATDIIIFAVKVNIVFYYPDLYVICLYNYYDITTLLYCLVD